MAQPLEVTLSLVPEHEKPVLATLTQLYRYDSSEFNDDQPDALGRFSVGHYFDAYWLEPGRHPFFIRFGGKIAGFALAREFEPGRFSVAEFFVLRTYRRQGVGRRAATLLFDTFKGEWHVAQETGNLPAQQFWRSVIGAYSANEYTETFSEQQPRGPKQVFRSRPA